VKSLTEVTKILTILIKECILNGIMMEDFDLGLEETMVEMYPDFNKL